jgi:hypothetical protein
MLQIPDRVILLEALKRALGRELSGDLKSLTTTSIAACGELRNTEVRLVRSEFAVHLNFLSQSFARKDAPSPRRGQRQSRDGGDLGVPAAFDERHARRDPELLGEAAEKLSPVGPRIPAALR